MAPKQKVLWSETPAGLAAYNEAKARAQALADADGFDRGIEFNDVFKCVSVRMLPQKRHRFGFEARIECVCATDLARCQPGHGPNAEGYEGQGRATR
jgi:hypothetical protein